MNTEVRQSSTATPLRGATNLICTDAHRGAQEPRMTYLPTNVDVKRHPSSIIDVLPCPFHPESPCPHAVSRSYSCGYEPTGRISAAYIDAGSQCVNNLPVGQRCFEQRKGVNTIPNRQTKPSLYDHSVVQMEYSPQLGSSVDLRQDQEARRALEVRCAWLEAENTDISKELQETKVRNMEKTAEFEDLVYRLQHIHKPEIKPEGLNLVVTAKSRREPIIVRSVHGKRKHPGPSDDDVAAHRCKRIRHS
jgi:hypothetical protein